MIKRIFRICLTVTVISLVVTLVLLPFRHAQHDGYRQPVGGIRLL